MREVLQKFTRKELFIGLLLGLMVFPWFGGGMESIAVLLSGFLLLVLTFLLFANQKRFYLELEDTTKYALFGFVVWTVMSLLWSVNSYNTLGFLLVIVQVGIFFVILNSLFTEERFRELWEKVFLFGAAIASIIGIYFYLAGEFERAISLFYWPNPFAAFLLVALFLSLKNAYEDRTKRSMALSAFFMMVLLLTFSLAAAGMFAALAIALVFAVSDKKRYVLTLVGVSVAAVLGLQLVNFVDAQIEGSPTVGTSGAASAEQKSASLFLRFDYWENGLEIFRDNPIGGVGAQNYEEVAPQYQDNFESFTDNPHNFYVQLLAEWGIVGFVLFVVGVGSLFFAWFKNSEKLDEEWFIVAAALGLFMHAGFDFDFRHPTLLFLAAALLVYINSFHSKWRISTSSAFIVKYATTATVLVLVISLAAINNYHQSYKELAEFKAVPKEAVMWYEKSLQAPLRDPDAVSGYAVKKANLFEGTEDPSELLSLLGEARAADRFDANHYFATGYVYERTGSPEQAEEYYKQAIRIDPLNHPEHYLELVERLLAKKEYEEALGYLEDALNEYDVATVKSKSNVPNLSENVAGLYIQRALIGINTGNDELFKKSLELSKELDPFGTYAQKIFLSN